MSRDFVPSAMTVGRQVREVLDGTVYPGGTEQIYIPSFFITAPS